MGRRHVETLERVVRGTAVVAAELPLRTFQRMPLATQSIVYGCAWVVFAFSLIPQDKKFDARTIIYAHPGEAPGNSTDGLLVFLQITDIHISRDGKDRWPSFEKFVKHTCPVVSPAFVLATGDLVDSHTSGSGANRQFEEEWQFYRQVLDDGGITNSTKNGNGTIWFDVRGNHDRYGVIEEGGPDDYFAKYSLSESVLNGRSSVLVVERSFGRYRVVGFDPTLDPGLPLPLNFFGIMSKYRMDRLKETLHGVDQFNHTILISHHPLSTVRFAATSDGDFSLRRLMNAYPILVHLCGHYHQPDMYTHDPLALGRFLRLGLTDFKDAKKFRVMALDSDIFSFADVCLDDCAYVLISNPKDCRFLTPSEPFDRILHSTHIRVLVFSNFSFVVSYSIDGVYRASRQSAATSTYLFAFPWNPRDFETGRHEIEVRVRCSSGETVRVKQCFSLDGTLEPRWPEFYQIYSHFPVTTFLKICFSLTHAFSFGYLIVTPKLFLMAVRIARKDGALVEHVDVFWKLEGGASRERTVGFPAFLCQKFLTTMYLYGHMNPAVWVGLFIFGVWALVGPWIMGPIFGDGTWGFVWVYGTVVAGKGWVAADDWYSFATVMLLLVYLPAVVLSSTILGLLPFQAWFLPLILLPYHLLKLAGRQCSMILHPWRTGSSRGSAPLYPSYLPFFADDHYRVKLHYRANRGKLRVRTTLLSGVMLASIILSIWYFSSALGGVALLLSPMILWLDVFALLILFHTIVSYWHHPSLALPILEKR